MSMVQRSLLIPLVLSAVFEPQRLRAMSTLSKFLSHDGFFGTDDQPLRACRLPGF